MFTNKTQAYHTEVAFTGAVVRELTLRTKWRVGVQAADEKNADAVLHGTIVAQTPSPLTYDSAIRN